MAGQRFAGLRFEDQGDGETGAMLVAELVDGDADAGKVGVDQGGPFGQLA